MRDEGKTNENGYRGTAEILPSQKEFILFTVHFIHRRQNLYYTDKSTRVPTLYTKRSCLIIETHEMKLPAYSLYADINARGGFGLL